MVETSTFPNAVTLSFQFPFALFGKTWWKLIMAKWWTLCSCGFRTSLITISPWQTRGLSSKGISRRLCLVVQTMGPPKPTFSEVFMLNNLLFRWPKPVFFMVLGAHGMFHYSKKYPSFSPTARQPSESWRCLEKQWHPRNSNHHSDMLGFWSCRENTLTIWSCKHCRSGFSGIEAHSS